MSILPFGMPVLRADVLKKSLSRHYNFTIQLQSFPDVGRLKSMNINSKHPNMTFHEKFCHTNLITKYSIDLGKPHSSFQYLIGIWRIKENFGNYTFIHVCLFTLVCGLAGTYLQPLHGNGVFGNVYLSAGKH